MTQANRLQEGHTYALDSQEPALDLVTEQLTAGQRLRRARQAQKLSIGQVASRLHLTTACVEAIEADRFDCLPGETYIRGYLRNYARFMGLSDEAVLSDYLCQLEQTSEAPRKILLRRTKGTGGPVFKASSYAVVLVFMLLSVVWWQSQEQAAVAGSVAITEEVTVETASGETIVESLAVVESGSEQVSKPLLQSSAVSAENQLLVEFVDRSWLEIRDANDDILFTGVKTAGETLDIKSLSSFNIVIGNAAAVELSYNSAPVDLARYADERNIAKLTLGL